MVVAAPVPEVELGARGLRLWESLHPGGERLPTPDAVIAEEACRLADRLDAFDAQLHAGSLLELDVVDDEHGGVVEVRVMVDKVVAEARQHALTLARLLGELRRIGTVAGKGADGDEVDDLAAQRARRLAAPAG